ALFRLLAQGHRLGHGGGPAGTPAERGPAPRSPGKEGPGRYARARGRARTHRQYPLMGTELGMLYEIGQANRLGTRSSNQDRFAAVETDDAVLLVLADGMGGHRGGEMAAQILVDVASEALLNTPLPVRDVQRFL